MSPWFATIYVVLVSWGLIDCNNTIFNKDATERGSFFSDNRSSGMIMQQIRSYKLLALFCLTHILYLT